MKDASLPESDKQIVRVHLPYNDGEFIIKDGSKVSDIISLLNELPSCCKIGQEETYEGYSYYIYEERLETDEEYLYRKQKEWREDHRKLQKAFDDTLKMYQFVYARCSMLVSNQQKGEEFELYSKKLREIREEAKYKQQLIKQHQGTSP